MSCDMPCSGDSDATTAVQLAMNAVSESGGGDLVLGNGSWRFGRAGSAYHCLALRDGVRLRGESRTGTVIRMAPETPESVRLIATEGASDAEIADLTMDGDADAQSLVPNLQRHGLFGDGSTRLRIRRVTTQNFAGDGLCFYIGANGTLVEDVLSTGNRRNGFTINGALTGLAFKDCQMVGNMAQQGDGEPGTGNVVRGVTLERCVLDPAGASQDYALAFGGPGSAEQTEGWRISKCRIAGAVMMAWARDVAITDCEILNSAPSPGITVYRNSCDIRITGNRIELTNAASGVSESAIRVLATGVGNQPDEVTIIANSIRVAHASNFGVDVRGALNVMVAANSVHGCGTTAAGYSGIRIRPTVAMRSAIVSRNRMRGVTTGVSVIAGAPIAYLDTTGNTLDNGTAVGLTP